MALNEIEVEISAQEVYKIMMKQWRRGFILGVAAAFIGSLLAQVVL